MRLCEADNMDETSAHLITKFQHSRLEHGRCVLVTVTLCTRMYTGPWRPLLLRLSKLSYGCSGGIVMVSPRFGLRLCRVAGRTLLLDVPGGCPGG
jgi:hypothetical protein